ncbi:MAG TPA: addiction module protein [Blastocatellia bacterium]|nr:addiction module protein [Blastocatellia bacterium]
MSKTEILSELPKLTPEERQEVRELLADLDGEDWLDDGELTDEEKRLIDARLDECERNPTAFVSWEEAKARMNASLTK